MKNNLPAFSFLFCAVFAAGCGGDPSATSPALTNKAEMMEPAHDAKNYSYARKAEFSEKLKTELAAINSELDELTAKVEKATDDVKAEAKPKLQALREKAEELKKQLATVGDATESTWESVESGASKAWAGVKDGLRQSRDWIDSKISK